MISKLQIGQSAGCANTRVTKRAHPPMRGRREPNQPNNQTNQTDAAKRPNEAYGDHALQRAKRMKRRASRQWSHRCCGSLSLTVARLAWAFAFLDPLVDALFAERMAANRTHETQRRWDVCVSLHTCARARAHCTHLRVCKHALTETRTCVCIGGDREGDDA